MPKNKKPTTTVGRWMREPGFKAAVAKERKDLLLSELVLALMADD